MKVKHTCGSRRMVKPLLLVALIASPASSLKGVRAMASGSDQGWSVQVRSKGQELLLTVWAANTPLAALARELERQLKLPVTLGRSLQAQRVTAGFTDLPLDQGLLNLAPRPLVDYAVGGGEKGGRQRVGVHLQAVNEREPVLPVGFKHHAESFLVEGHTEGEAVPKDREPLWVSWAGGRLSLRAKKQPLTVVLARIAEQTGVPFEVRRDSDDLVTLELHHLDLEEAVRLLPGGARLYLRADLRGRTSRPLRIASEKAK